MKFRVALRINTSALLSQAATSRVSPGGAYHCALLLDAPVDAVASGCLGQCLEGDPGGDEEDGLGTRPSGWQGCCLLGHVPMDSSRIFDTNQ